MDGLHVLVRLQEVDTAIDQARHRRANLPERKALAALRSELAGVRSTLTEMTGARDTAAEEQRRREAEVEAIEVKRASLAKKLAATAVPREADALTAELAALRARQDEHEERLLELMEDDESRGPRLEALVADEASLAERHTVATAELAAAEAAVDAEMAALDTARVDAAAAVPDGLLTRYEKLRAHLGGVAVARLDGARCTGCNLTLPTSEVERLRHLAADTLAECEQCGRLLVH
jgi:predicted  nucleic acid-binding Zn-ribbon protein